MKTVHECIDLCAGISTPTITDAINVTKCSDIAVSVCGDITNLLLTFECSLDNTNWFKIEGSPMHDQSVFSTTATVSNTIYTFNCSAVIFFRIRIDEITGGNISMKAVSYTS